MPVALSVDIRFLLTSPALVLSESMSAVALNLLRLVSPSTSAGIGSDIGSDGNPATKLKLVLHTSLG